MKTLEDCNLSKRAVNALRENGYHYSLKQLRAIHDIESLSTKLLRGRNCGKKTVNEILRLIGRKVTKESYKCPICGHTHWCYGKAK